MTFWFVWKLEYDDFKIWGYTRWGFQGVCFCDEQCRLVGRNGIMEEHIARNFRVQGLLAWRQNWRILLKSSQISAGLSCIMYKNTIIWIWGYVCRKKSGHLVLPYGAECQVGVAVWYCCLGSVYCVILLLHRFITHIHRPHDISQLTGRQ